MYRSRYLIRDVDGGIVTAQAEKSKYIHLTSKRKYLFFKEVTEEIRNQIVIEFSDPVGLHKVSGRGVTKITLRPDETIVEMGESHSYPYRNETDMLSSCVTSFFKSMRENNHVPYLRNVSIVRIVGFI